MGLQRSQTSTPRTREGSPWTGVWAVVGKDMSDHLTSARMLILEFLILVSAVGTVYAALQSIRQASTQSSYIFLSLFTTGQNPVPAFVGFLGVLVPLIAITLAFDAVNGEFNQRTLSRVLAQPIYRDALLLGKFLAGLFTLALVLAAIWLLVIGLGVVGLGIPPSTEEIVRILFFLLVTIFYGGIWLALAMVFSTVFRQPATAALASIAVWLFMMIFWGILATILAKTFAPVHIGTMDELLRQARLTRTLERFSPNTLFAEATLGLMNPTVRSFGLFLPTDLTGALLGQPLPLGASIMLIWPHLTGLVAATILLFALSYVLFQRQEIRA